MGCKPVPPPPPAPPPSGCSPWIRIRSGQVFGKGRLFKPAAQSQSLPTLKQHDRASFLAWPPSAASLVAVLMRSWIHYSGLTSFRPRPTAKVLMSWGGWLGMGLGRGGGSAAAWSRVRGPGSWGPSVAGVDAPAGRGSAWAPAFPLPVPALAKAQLWRSLLPRPSAFAACFDPTCFPASSPLAGPISWPPEPGLSSLPPVWHGWGLTPPGDPSHRSGLSWRLPRGSPACPSCSLRSFRRPGTRRSADRCGLEGQGPHCLVFVCLNVGLPCTPLGHLFSVPVAPGRGGHGVGTQ